VSVRSKEQWISVYSHRKYGYSLMFVRIVDENPLAVMQREKEDIITINHVGDIGDIGDITGITLRD
jgi:hypothetical protein